MEWPAVSMLEAMNERIYASSMKTILKARAKRTRAPPKLGDRVARSFLRDVHNLFVSSPSYKNQLHAVEYIMAELMPVEMPTFSPSRRTTSAVVILSVPFYNKRRSDRLRRALQALYESHSNLDFIEDAVYVKMQESRFLKYVLCFIQRLNARYVQSVMRHSLQASFADFLLWADSGFEEECEKLAAVYVMCALLERNTREINKDCIVEAGVEAGGGVWPGPRGGTFVGQQGFEPDDNEKWCSCFPNKVSNGMIMIYSRQAVKIVYLALQALYAMENTLYHTRDDRKHCHPSFLVRYMMDPLLQDWRDATICDTDDVRLWCIGMSPDLGISYIYRSPILIREIVDEFSKKCVASDFDTLSTEHAEVEASRPTL